MLLLTHSQGRSDGDENQRWSGERRRTMHGWINPDACEYIYICKSSYSLIQCRDLVSTAAPNDDAREPFRRYTTSENSNVVDIARKDVVRDSERRLRSCSTAGDGRGTRVALNHIVNMHAHLASAAVARIGMPLHRRLSNARPMRAAHCRLQHCHRYLQRMALEMQTTRTLTQQ